MFYLQYVGYSKAFLLYFRFYYKSKNLFSYFQEKFIFFTAKIMPIKFDNQFFVNIPLFL